MKIKNHIYSVTLLVVIALLGSTFGSSVKAQHILGVTGGIGSSSIRFYPNLNKKSVYGKQNYGVTWRYYSAERFVGGVGVDVEYMQRGFKFSPALIDGERYYYTRNINTLMVPLVWQPHAYIFYRKVRVFAEAAITFSYDISSTYNNNYERELYESIGITSGVYDGDYDYRVERDNRFGYGLAGGAGLSLLLGERVELMARARYYFGLSDVVRNRNKYYSNNLDGFENPFSLTPIRSNIDSFFVNIGLCIHLGKRGFASWSVKPPKRVKGDREFNFSGNESVPLN